MSRRLGIALSLVLIAVALWTLRRDEVPPPQPGRPEAAPGGPRIQAREPGAGFNGGVGAQPQAPGGADLPPAAPMRGGPQIPPGLSPREVLDITIRTATEDPDPNERAAAIADLALEDDLETILPVLNQVASDPDPDVKMAVVMALDQLAEAAPVDLLAKFAADPDPDIRLEVLAIIETLAEEDGMPDLMRPILVRAARDPNEDVRDKAQEIIDYLAQLSGEEQEDEEE